MRTTAETIALIEPKRAAIEPMPLSDLAEPGLPNLPAGAYVGKAYRVAQTAPRSPLWLVYVFGGYGAWGPGWFVLGDPARRLGLPLAGPYDTEQAALADIHATEQASLHIQGHYGFISQSALLFDPCVVLREDKIAVGRKSRIDAFCKLEGGDGILIGDYVHIASFCHLNVGGGTLVLEEGASMGSGSCVVTGSAQIGHESCSATHPNVVNKKSTVRIGKGATLFVHATVLPGCTIGEGATIGAGALVLANTVVPAGELWAGVPAKKVR